ncbi:MAG: carbohydrate ABC transporter permease [Deltaproteobacteria bacterium]|nr:carbohydrate ABC transporter permease [Deltaproteobacteria bacterium]
MLALVLAFCLGPIGWLAVTSLKADEELGSLPPLLPGSPTFEHYRLVLRSPAFGRVLLNSLLLAAGVTLVALTLGAMAAYALARLRVRGAEALLLVILAASVFPPIATVSPLYLVIRALGLRDTLWALLITDTGHALPFAIWLLTHFFRQLPLEVEQAAAVDGCTPAQVLRKVTLPLAAPALSSTGLLIFIFAWNEFLYAVTFTTTPASRTVPVAIALFPGIHEVPWGDLAAASLLVTAPLFVLILIFQRRIVAGLTAGALRG